MSSWRRDLAFDRLCDLVASDRLVVFSGAGISTSLPKEGEPGKSLPSWPALLKDLFRSFSDRIDTADRIDCEKLLSLKSPSGESLITVASIIRSADPKAFDSAFRAAITEEAGSTTRAHRVLESLHPRGILTFNYDRAHESAYKSIHKCDIPWILTPWNEAGLRQALQGRLAERFLMKAHGSISDADELVLTEESYRRLIVRSPAYRSFIQNLLTNFNLLVVGFRFSDPDFDIFINAVAHQYGSPLHDHIGIMHRQERQPDREILLRRRFGIRLLFIDDFAEIPTILAESTKTAGPRLRTTIEDCLHPEFDRRSHGHRELRRLGVAGRAVASRVLSDRISNLAAAGEDFELAEVAYSLGILDSIANKDVLLNLVQTSTSPDVVGRALTVLRPALRPKDLPFLHRLQKRLATDPLKPDPLGRIPLYLDYLGVYVRQRFHFSNKRTSNHH